MYGTCLIVTQNFAVSGANQVLLNMVNGGFYNGNIMVFMNVSVWSIVLVRYSLRVLAPSRNSSKQQDVPLGLAH